MKMIQLSIIIAYGFIAAIIRNTYITILLCIWTMSVCIYIDKLEEERIKKVRRLRRIRKLKKIEMDKRKESKNGEDN